MSDIKDCSTCSKPSDNQQFNCPPKMADGRHFTDYRPRCSFNSRSNYMIADPKNANGFKTPPINSYDLRQFMIENSEALMEMNREVAFQRNMCGPCVENPSVDVGTMLPEQTMVTCDKNSCSVSLNDSRGLGMGRQYITKDAQDSPEGNHGLGSKSFDVRRQIKDPKGCCANVFDDAQYYPINGKIADDYGRMAIPGGGKPLSGTSRTNK